MKKSIQTAVILIAIATLTGCKIEMEIDLYSSDLRAAALGDESLTTPATLALPITSVDECAEQTEKIVQIMQNIMESIQPKGCELKNFESFMLADVQVPLLNSADSWDQTDTLFGIVSQSENDDKFDEITVFVTLNLLKYENLSQRVEDEFFQALNLADSKFTLAINNDERESAEIYVENVFVQGAPEISGTYSIPRRSQVEIELSNVSVAYLGQEGWAYGLTLINKHN